jgi:hypothetical protein
MGNEEEEPSAKQKEAEDLAEQMAQAAADVASDRSRKALAEGRELEAAQESERMVKADNTALRLREQRQARNKKKHHSEPPRPIQDFQLPGSQSVPGIATRGCRMG